MIGEFLRVVVRVAGFAAAIGLIGMIIMWFGCIPMVGMIFGQINGWMYLAFTAVMVGLLILIVRWMRS